MPWNRIVPGAITAWVVVPIVKALKKILVWFAVSCTYMAKSLLVTHRAPTALFVASIPLTGAAYFHMAVPFWLSLLPLLIALWFTQTPIRIAAMAGFLFWPTITCIWGLIGTGLNPTLVIMGALVVVIAICLGAAFAGIAVTAIMVTAIPFFPASPLLPLADLLTGLGSLDAGMAIAILIAGIVIVLVGDISHDIYLRRACLVTIGAAVALWNMANVTSSAKLGTLSSSMHVLLPNQTQNTTAARADIRNWHQLSIPLTITQRTKWLAIRNMAPLENTLILGENTFAADDNEAKAFWCDTAIRKRLTVFIGVEEPYKTVTRGAVWRFDTQTCSNPRQPKAVYKARIGIPQLTGTWGLMGAGGMGESVMDVSAPNSHMSRPLVDGNEPHYADTANRATAPSNKPIHWMICLEAFLPRIWWQKWWQYNQPGTRHKHMRRPTGNGDQPDLIVISNDTAFGTFPVHTLRRKSAQAMANMLDLGPVHYAQAKHSFLIKPSQTEKAGTP